MMYVLLGQGVYEVYSSMVKEGASLLRIDAAYALLIIAFLFLLRIVAGGLAGWIGWDLGRVVRGRLAR
jgi:hypothetical protein